MWESSSNAVRLSGENSQPLPSTGGGGCGKPAETGGEGLLEEGVVSRVLVLEPEEISSAAVDDGWASGGTKEGGMTSRFESASKQERRMGRRD